MIKNSKDFKGYMMKNFLFTLLSSHPVPLPGGNPMFQSLLIPSKEISEMCIYIYTHREREREITYMCFVCTLHMHYTYTFKYTYTLHVYILFIHVVAYNVCCYELFPPT